MSVTILVCGCGMRLRTPGAVPGRVGKCPRCGSMLKVPEVEAEAEVAVKSENARPVELPPARQAGRATFVGRRSKKAPTNKIEARFGASGLVKPPLVAETRLVDSLTYPLWNDSGLAILVFMPPLIWITTMPMFAILPGVAAGKGYSIAFVVLTIPFVLLLMFIYGHIFQFMGQILVSSAIGEVTMPRTAGWDIFETLRCLGRWVWALVIGGAVGGFPPLIYWIYCGEVDLFDRIVLIDLIVPGLAYAQMALLACLIHDSPMAANPVTVLRAIYRAGWGYLGTCLFSGVAFLVLGGLLIMVMNIADELIKVVAYLLFCSVALYTSMVVLRRLGLFCFRNAIILEWFPGRSRRTLDEEEV